MKPLKNVKTVDDFEVRCEQILDDYLFSMVGVDGLTREPEEGDLSGVIDFEDIGWMYTQRSMELIKRIKDRLKKVGEHHFPNQHFVITTSYLIEP